MRNLAKLYQLWKLFRTLRMETLLPLVSLRLGEFYILNQVL